MVRPNKYVLRYIFLALLVIILTPFVVWNLEKPAYISAVIVDKTVPKPSYREHKGLMWILNNLKAFNRETGAPFVFNRDYFGFFPLANNAYDVRNLPEDPNGVDLIYLADTYGVYSEDFFTDNQRGKRSDLIYGGTDESDLKFIKGALAENAMLVGEFNSLQTPTSDNNRANTLART